jgi:hypothetical protein
MNLEIKPNLVFVLGYAVYYHHEDISIFLDTVHGTKNDLLKAVSLNIKEKLFLAGAKALGLISKFVKCTKSGSSVSIDVSNGVFSPIKNLEMSSTLVAPL